jgi:hypothetical protein
LTEWLLIGILVILLLIFWRLTEIYLKLTERQRLTEQKKTALFQANIQRADLETKAWHALSAEDKARFNDFHYEHAMGEISDEQYEKMKEELREKTGGVLQ